MISVIAKRKKEEWTPLRIADIGTQEWVGNIIFHNNEETINGNPTGGWGGGGV